MPYSLDPNSPHKWQHWSKFKTPKAATRRSIAADGTWEYRVHLKAVQHAFHPLIPKVKVWTYGNGTASDKWPGVTIEAQSNVPVRVTYVNDLVGENLYNLIALGTRQGMEEMHMLNAVSHNQTHLHGARVPWTSDGSPMNVFHPHETRGYYYPNKQAAATLWYHDHSMDVTRLNVYAGLAGMYLLRDPAEAARLPTGEFEVPLVLQDRSFTPDLTKLRYEQSIDLTGTEPVPTPEFLGDFPVVNGKIWPTMQAKRGVYRWRLVNGANTRYFKLRLTKLADPATKIGFHIIGTDGGLLPAALPLDELVLAPGERADLLVDLTQHAGAELILRNSADIPYPGDATLANAGFPCDELLRILVAGPLVAGQNKFKPAPAGTLTLPLRVDPLPGGDLAGIAPNSTIEAAIQAKLLATEGATGSILPVEHLGLVTAGVNPLTFNYRRFVLEEYQLLMPTLAGVLAPPNALGVVDFTNQTIPTVMVNGADVKTAAPVVTNKDAYEVWEFVNLTPDSHPMHIHLVQFRVLSRLELNKVSPPDVDADPTRTPVSQGLWEPKRALGYNLAATTVVQPYEAQGWKDTVQCEPGQATRMLMRFDGYSGEYVYHCHILEHEDMGMMFDLIVEP